MANFGTVGTVTVLKEVGQLGGLRAIRFSVVGDGAYATGGSTDFLKKLRAAAGEDVRIISLEGQGANKLSTTPEELEYTPRGNPLDCKVVASSDLFTSYDASGVAVAHGFSAGQAVRFFRKNQPGAENGGAIKSLNNPDPVMPSGVTEDTVYYVIASGLTSTAFKVSASSGGSTIDVTDAGLGDFVVVSEDMLLIRKRTDGTEDTTADQSAATYTGVALCY